MLFLNDSEQLKKHHIVWFVLLIAIVGIVYYPVILAGQFINFDDNTHIFLNTLVCNNNLKAVWDIFFTPDSANKTYVPITVVTFLYERLLFGALPTLSHAINVLLHLLVCFLAFFLARYLGLNLRAAFWSVLIFAVHPVHVEAVAWITARKDLLFTSFYLMAMISYCQYQDDRNARHYIFALAAAGLSVLSKPMALSLPLALCLLDYLRSRRMSWGAIVDKIPFFLVVEPIALITYSMNARGVPFSWHTSPFIWVWSASFYLQKFFCPLNLSIIYGYPSRLDLWNTDVFRGFMVIFLFAVVLFKNWRWKLFLFAALFYILTAFFLWRFDIFDLTTVADRFMYLPSLGFCFVIGYLVDYAFTLKKKVFIAVSLSVFVFFLLLSSHRVFDWVDSFSIWNATVKTNPSAFSFDMRGQSLYTDDFYMPSKASFLKFVARTKRTDIGRMRSVFKLSFDQKIAAARKAAALRSFQFALAREPLNPELYEDAGLAYASFNQFYSALNCFETRFKLSKKPSVSFFYNWGVVYQQLHQDDLAMVKYNMAIRVNPDYNLPYLNRAQIWLDKKQPLRALTDALTAIEKDPTFSPAYDTAISIARGYGDNKLEKNLISAQRKLSFATGSGYLRPAPDYVLSDITLK
ncbi:MAG: glycosyltransferase family 39 protein [Candidatus Omnitrophica bacterium]|nr:glycosyltransferase family 39 protein [Candidatus Omnitrophota bacterium]